MYINSSMCTVHIIVGGVAASYLFKEKVFLVELVPP